MQRHVTYKPKFGVQRLRVGRDICGTTTVVTRFMHLYILLAGLHKVYPAYRMVNAGRAGWRAGGRAGVFNRAPTLCNQLLPHL
jgi:hypothetical protein